MFTTAQLSMEGELLFSLIKWELYVRVMPDSV
jgi:hypothetical protein